MIKVWIEPVGGGGEDGMTVAHVDENDYGTFVEMLERGEWVWVENATGNPFRVNGKLTFAHGKTPDQTGGNA